MEGKGAIAASDRSRLRSEPEAERTIIAVLLRAASNGDDDCAIKVFDAIQARDFSDAKCRTIFAAMERLHQRGEPLEHGLLVAALKGEIENPVGLLSEVLDGIATTAHIDRYVKLVAEASRQRRAVGAVNDALNSLRNCNGDAGDAIATLREELADIDRGSSHGAELVCVADVEPEPVEWLWTNRIAIGKVTLLAGDPGLGKSPVTLGIASAVSRGAPWPDAPHAPQPVGGVVLLSAEDDLADTIRPRLDAHEADCSRVVALTSLADLTRDIDQLRAAIERTPDCRLVIVDPVSAYMGKADSHNNAEVRGMLAPLAALAAEERVAILAVTHLRKGEGAALYRAMGSLAFVAAARAVWVVCPCKTNPRRRLMLPIKNNLAPDSKNGLAFTVECRGLKGAPVVCWESEPVSITADEAMAIEVKKRGPAPKQHKEAIDWLNKDLAAGSRPREDVIDDAEDMGFSERTIQRAFREIGGLSKREGFGKRAVWSLPSDANALRPGQPGTNGETGRISVCCKRVVLAARPCNPQGRPRQCSCESRLHLTDYSTCCRWPARNRPGRLGPGDG